MINNIPSSLIKTTCLAVIAVSVVSCCSIKVAPQGGTKAMLKENKKHPVQDNVKIGRIGICRLKTDDMHMAMLFKNFVDSLEAKYRGQVVKNYEPGDGRYVNRYVEFEIRPAYDFNRGTSVAVSWPGALVLAPTWWGLVYILELNTKVVIYDGANRRVIDEIFFKDSFRVRHASFGRAIWCYSLGLHPIFGCVGGVFSGWDEGFKESVTAKIIEKNLFTEAYTIRLLRALSSAGIQTAKKE